MKHTLRWFKNRRGEKIKRVTKLNCQCGMCQNPIVEVSHGFHHAEYLKLCQDELGIEYEDLQFKNGN